MVLVIGVIVVVTFIAFTTSYYPSMTLLFLILVIIAMLTPIFLNNIEFLFYVFMLFFAFGEVGVQISPVLPKLSFSNLWLIYSSVILIVHFLMTRNDQNIISINKRGRLLIIATGILLLLVLYSSIAHSSYRSLLTQIGYLLVLIMTLSVIRNKTVLLQGLKLGIISISLLSVFTILTSIGVISFGFRVGWDSGLAPWEYILPRAIGLPQMEAGNHNVFLISILPISLMVYQKLKRKNPSLDLLRILGIGLGIIAVLISLFRSGWLGLSIAFLVYFLLNVKHFYSPRNRYLVYVLIILALIGIMVYLSYNHDFVLQEINRVFFEIRGGGVDKRLAQYSFAIRRIPESFRSILVGYGENAIRKDFPLSPEAYGLRGDLDLGLHNQFLGFMYSFGVPYILIYIFMFFKTAQWYYDDIRLKDSTTRRISQGLLAGLLGSFVVLLFTASLTGYKIIWVLFSISTILPKINERS